MTYLYNFFLSIYFHLHVILENGFFKCQKIEKNTIKVTKVELNNWNEVIEIIPVN